MATWPSTLPQALLKGWVEQPQDIAIRTEMDQGPAKTRRRFTAGVTAFTGRMVLTLAQTSTLDTFYGDYPATSFDMPHPRTSFTASVRFAAPPEYEYIGSDLYYATLRLEALP